MPDAGSIPKSSPITICTVSYHHASHLRLNIELAAKLNPDAEIRWLVGENTPVGSPLRLPASPAPNVDVIATEGLIPEGSQSAQNFHTTALHALIERVMTRFMAILDPDFFPVPPGWVNQVTSHMQANGLTLFGAPWHPRHVRKYRYFPAVHCTIVDRDAFKDRPYTVKNLHDYKQALQLKARYRAPGVPASALLYKWRSVFLRRLFPARWKQSWTIWDTGTALFARYWMGESIPNECLIPVFNPTSELGFIPALLDTILPENLSYTPKRRGSYSSKGGFLPRIPETTDWEQFLWRGLPFGFHMRGNSNRGQRDAQGEVALARQIIETLLEARERQGNDG